MLCARYCGVQRVLARLFPSLAALASCSSQPREVNIDVQPRVDREETREGRLPRSIVRDDMAEGKPVVELTLGFKATDAELKEAAKYKRLRRLSMSRCEKYTDAGLKELAALPELQWLDLSETCVTDAGLKHLAAVHSLRTLDLSNTNVTDDGLKTLASLKNLRTLHLRNIKVSEAGVKAGLRALPQLKVTRAGLKALAMVKSLQRLDFSCINVTAAGLKDLAQLQGLQALALNGKALEAADLKDLAALLQLKELVLVNTELTAAALNDLAALKSLQTLTLRYSKLADTSLKGLAALKTLKELVLDNTERLAPASLRDLAAVDGLRMVCLIDYQNDKSSDAWMKELAPLQGLQELYVNCWRASTGGVFIGEPEQEADADPNHAGPSKRVQGGNLWNSELTSAGLKECAALKGLEKLHVASNAITDGGLKCVGSA